MQRLLFFKIPYLDELNAERAARITQLMVLCRRRHGLDALRARRLHQPLLRRAESLRTGADPFDSRGVSAGGREIIETNTFGANRFRLARMAWQDKVFEINRPARSWRARRSAHLKDKQAGEAWVAGSVGPLGRAAGAAGQDFAGRSAGRLLPSRSRALAAGGRRPAGDRDHAGAQ
jgi:hypothetical protein